MTYRCVQSRNDPQRLPASFLWLVVAHGCVDRNAGGWGEKAFPDGLPVCSNREHTNRDIAALPESLHKLLRLGAGKPSSDIVVRKALLVNAVF